jgi:hypothetical protein
LYYRFPHRTGPWKLVTTINTNSTGYYSAVGTVPYSLSPGNYDLVAVWFNQRPGTYAASPVALLTVPFALAFSAQEVQPAATWSIETVDSIGWVNVVTSIALDSGNNPHISYHDSTNGDLKYARWTGSAWSIETVDSIGWVGERPSIALDSGNNPHISYHDATNGDLKYARWTGSAWSIETVDSAGYVGMGTSIALDSGNNPHISYWDFTNGDLKYARWTGSAWSIQTVDSTGAVGYCTSIALDSSDRPHISYPDGTNGNLKYARWTGSAWSIQTVDSTGWDTSIALDSGNNPHISYWDTGNFALKYARWTGSAWSIQTVDSAGYVGEDTSIALDSGNNPHISYRDDTNRDLKYARWIDSVWSIQTVDSAGDVGYYTSIALDSSDNPHISYYGNGDLKYAKGLGYSVLSVSVNPPSQTVTAGDSVEHTVTVTLLAGNPGTVGLSLDLPLSVGVYTFTPPTGTPTFTSTLIIHTHKTASAGTYTLNVIATPEVGATRKTSLTLEVQACPTLTLDLTPQTVARGQPLLISGQLTPAQTATIQLYYRYPHRTGPWELATTINTNTAGYYSVIVTVPASVTPGSYDLVAVWFNQSPGTYAASPVALLTVI